MTLLLHRVRLWWGRALWVIPLLGILVAWSLSKVLSELQDELAPVWPIELSPSSAQAFLAAVGGGMVTFTGFVFSVVLLMLQFGSSMYSPRAASFFLRKRTTQWVLAIFLGTITMSFSELISVGSLGRADFVPVLNVALTVLALFASLVGFLALLQSVSGQLRVDTLLSTIGAMSRDQLRRRASSRGEADLTADLSTDRPDAGSVSGDPSRPLDVELVRCQGRPGQLVDVARRPLERMARASGSEIRLLVRVGDGVSEGAPIAAVVGVRPGDRELSRCLLVQPERSLRHDPLYALRLVVDLALLEVLEAGLQAAQVTRRLSALLGDLLADLPERAHAPLLRYQRRLVDEVTRTQPPEDHANWLTGDRQGIGGSR